MTTILTIIAGAFIVALICKPIHRDGYRQGWNDCHYQSLYDNHLVGTEEQKPVRGRV